ncbi:MAG: autorepressor SdpR family transcription factor [Lachnospiraceae bacterium]|nr:autorepressor SdpR family transcription factor [Lachnospiraceae bacterium]
MGDINIFKVLSDQQRRDILVMLKSGRMNAGEIAERLRITPAALSYHLKMLKAADLILEYKQKNFIFYEINTSVFEELILWIGQFGGHSASGNSSVTGQDAAPGAPGEVSDSQTGTGQAAESGKGQDNAADEAGNIKEDER